MITAYYIVSHLQRQHLLIVENIFDNDDGTAGFCSDLFVGLFVALLFAEFRDTYSDAELFATVRTFEYQ